MARTARRGPVGRRYRVAMAADGVKPAVDGKTANGSAWPKPTVAAAQCYDRLRCKRVVTGPSTVVIGRLFVGGERAAGHPQPGRSPRVGTGASTHLESRDRQHADWGWRRA